jgi:hypothetical protein
MKILSITTTILCGLAIAILVYGMINNWKIPIETIITWGSACALCPAIVLLKD